jgi:hypothetical protein
MVYNIAKTLPNFINPFWMLPLLGILGLKSASPSRRFLLCVNPQRVLTNNGKPRGRTVLRGWLT